MYDNLNILRAISIIGIVIGHACLSLGYEPFGRFCGYLFVQIFFLLSSFLLGLKYGDRPLSYQFIIKRWKRLSAVYYPFLIISVFALSACGLKVTWKAIVCHLLYVNYMLQVDLCGIAFGHLWYISMIMMCYALITIVCYKGMMNRLINNLLGGGKTLIFSIITFAAISLFLRLGFPCRIPIVLASYLLIFKKAKDIDEWFNRRASSRFISTLAFIFSNVLCLSLFLYWNLNDKLLIRDLTILLTACFWLMFFMTVLRRVKCKYVLAFLSSISFELYLVHHPFVLGEFSWLSNDGLTGHLWTNIICVSIVIVILSHVLHKIGEFVGHTS